MVIKPRTIIYTLLALGLFMLVAYYSVRESPIAVEVGLVEKGPMKVTIDEQGETRTHDRFVISAPVAGRLLRIAMHDGDTIKEGSAVAYIDPVPLSAREKLELTSRVDAAAAYKREADQRVAQLQAAYLQAKRERERAEKLSADGLISPQQMEQARSAEVIALKELEAARFRSRAANSELAMARAGLIAMEPNSSNLVTLRSPVSGQVLRVIEKSERVVEPATPLMIIGNPGDLEIVVDVLSTDAVRIRPGSPVTITDWGGENDLQGRVRTVEPFAFTKVSALGIEEQRVNVIIDLIEHPATLGDGYRVECRIEIWSNPSVIKVPMSALFRTNGGWSVFVVEQNRARKRSVKIGQKNAEEAEVLSGISPGTMVILHPPNELEEDALVVEAR